jgi:hypothetical protein
MKLNQHSISIKKLHALYIPDVGLDSLDTSLGRQGAMTLAAQMMSYGFIPSEVLHNTLAGVSRQNGELLHEAVMPVLAELKGAHVKHKPMYVNFPQQVMEMDELELFLNAITHYWSFGEWKPDYPELPRSLAFENTKYIELGVVTDEDLGKVFTRLLSSNESISAEDKTIIEWFMESGRKLNYPATIPFKENLCVVAGMFIKAGKPIDKLAKTATDVLRIATFLSEGDVSLAANTKFRSLPRSQRKMFIQLLEQAAKDRGIEEDINRHRGKWGRLFHALHVGDYAKTAPLVYKAAQKIRDNKSIPTFNGRVNRAINERDPIAAVALLQKRPGEFARRLDHLFRTFDDKGDDHVIDGFLHVAPKISTRVVGQVMGHLQTRMETPTERVVFPKGNTQKAQLLPALPALRQTAVSGLYEGLTTDLLRRFGELEPLGKVFIDSALKDCPVPSQQRSASAGSLSVARGTRLPFGDDTKNTLRFFIYWKGRDIDLSATLHDAEFKMMERIGYTNLRSKKYESCHSGDITSAPNGASEFIDITIDKAVEAGARYVVMNVLVYSGPTFAEHETCFAGWMTRSKPGSNEIYDPKTVEGKVDLASNSKNAIPVIFDLVDRKAIWTDLTTNRNPNWGAGFHRGGFRTGWRGAGNNVENNKASIEQTVKAITKTTYSKLSLYKLFELHAQARGIMVTERDKADTVFALEQPSTSETQKIITPYDVNLISSEFLA